MAPTKDYITYGYAFMVIAGGLAGYLKTGSVPSLAAGVLFGGIAAFGAYKNNLPIGLVTSASLLGVMGYRFMKTGKIMPAGVVAGLSLIQAIRLGLQYKSS